MGMGQIGTSLPEIYRSFLPSPILELATQESLATCENCPQISKGAKPRYHESLKCCTFYPLLTNYLVGGVLAEHLPGADLICRQISQRQYVLPLGLGPSPAYQWRFINKNEKDFGNNPDLVCPFFAKNTGGCGLWKYRSSECRSFFCRSEKGEAGERFWRAFNEYLFFVEINLSQEFLLQTGFLPADFKAQLGRLKRLEFHSGDGQNWYLSEWEYQKLWDHWFGREREFFLQAYEWVKSLSQKNWNRDFGRESRKYEQAVLEAYQRTHWAKTRSFGSLTGF